VQLIAKLDFFGAEIQVHRVPPAMNGHSFWDTSLQCPQIPRLAD
jgi:hypothetical protein